MSRSPRTDSRTQHEPETRAGRFDVARVTELFERCALADGGVDLPLYILGYGELNKLFPMLGALFTFVESDVADKEKVLQEYVDGAQRQHYATVRSMIKWECDQSTARTVSPPSGSRTLLRLHRALLFIARLVGDIAAASGDAKMGLVARRAYDDTLAQHHPWLVRQGVHIAVKMLHTRHKFLRDLSGREDVESAEVTAVLGELKHRLDVVYERCQKHFADHDCLDLP